ncbi:hypothetical protein C3L33_13880, partial [Rhododendron williamsianum]
MQKQWLLLLLVMSCCYYNIVQLLGAQNARTGLIEVDVGLILDLDNIVGKMSRTCIYMALDDFYALHDQNHTTRIVLHTIDSKSDVVEAASADQVFEKTQQPKARSAAGNGIAVPFKTCAVSNCMSVSATDDHILQELNKLKTLQTRVFVVHMLPSLASRFFLKVKEVGMMSKGYVWIITDVLTILLDSLDAKVINSMEGVLGVKPYVPNSNELQNFTQRWRKRFRRENPDIDRFELNVLGLWAYDSATTLAMAVERSGVGRPKFKKPVSTNNSTDLVAIGYSEMGPGLLQAIKKTKFQGLSGEFHLVDGQLQQSTFRIVNVIGKGETEIGFWAREYGISKNKRLPFNKNDTNDKEDLKPSFGPVDSMLYLKAGKFQQASPNNAVIATGFCIAVFKEVMDHTLPYAVPYEFFPFETPDGEPAGDYNDLVYQIYLGKYDAVVGDVTILANRSNFVDFTLPFTESSVAMIVRIKDDERKNAWIFMKPLKMNLWLTIVVFFVFTGFVVWVLEHRVNKEFRGPPSKQVGIIFWFSFSTLVFAHREVDQQLIKVCGNRVGFRGAGTDIKLYSKLNINVNRLLKREEFNLPKSRNYSTFEQYDDALSRGSKMEELLQLSTSSLIAILNVKEGGKLTQIQRQWFGEEAECAEQDGAKTTSDSLDLVSFKGLFLVAATSLISALIISLSTFLYDNRVTLASNESSIWQKLIAMAKNFDEEEVNSYDASKKTNRANEVMVVPANCPQSPTRNNSQLAEWNFTDNDQGFTTTENSTSIHETIEIVDTIEAKD